MAFVTYQSGGMPPENYKKSFLNKDLSKEWTYEELWEDLFNSENSPIPKKLTGKHRVVVVDADAIVYRTSVACEKKRIIANIGGKSKKFRNISLLKSFCKDKMIDFQSIDYEIVLKVEPIEDCIDTLMKVVAKIHRQLKATHVIFILGGSVNFRHDIKLPTKYKENRKDKEKPRHLAACREFLNKHYDTYIVSGVEADDCVQGVTEYIINNTEAYAAAYQLDKDFHTSMTPNRYWHIMKNEIVELDGGLGRLYKSGSDVKGDGLMWVLFQLMLGDPSDGYSPKIFYREPYQKKYGDMAFFNDFKDFDNEQDLLVAWVNKWENLLPEVIEFEDFNGTPQKHHWLSLAEIYFQCLYMKMSPNDNTTFESLLNRYGVIVDNDTGYIHTIDVEVPEVKKLKKKVEVPDSEFGFGW